MTNRRDPLGKRALFTGAAAPSATGQHSRGLFDFTVHCSSCDASTTLTTPELVIQNFPMSVWIPWRKHSHLMRCPACNQLSWHDISLVR